MLGPLPRLHRPTVLIAAVLAGPAVALWVGWFLPIHVLPTALATLGILAGAGAAYALIHVRGTEGLRPHR